MSLHELTAHRDPQDLLCRFVPTPLRTRFRHGVARVVVQTNDFSLLPALPLDGEPKQAHKPVFEWKVIRDLDATGPLGEPVILDSQLLTVVGLGPACLVCVDHERKELLGFIGAQIDARTYQEFLVPFFCRLSDGTGLDDSRLPFGKEREENHGT
jgi:hypothetical protein